MYNIVINQPECLVVDDFLSTEDWKKLYNQIQVDKWLKINNAADKYWHLTDGDGYKTKRLISKERPFHNNYDIWFHRLSKFFETKEAKKFMGDIIGFSCRAYAYPVGGKNPWHNDLGMMTYAFFIHKHWQINWDGTLLIIPVNQIDYNQLFELTDGSKGNDQYSADNIPMEMFEQNEKYKKIMDYGRGTFISPKPNRLVIINKNVIHGVNRVDKDAGENSRISLSGSILPLNYDGPVKI